MELIYIVTVIGVTFQFGVVCGEKEFLQREDYEPPSSWKIIAAKKDYFKIMNSDSFRGGIGAIGVAILLPSRKSYGDVMRLEAIKWLLSVSNKFDYLRGFKLEICTVYYLEDVKTSLKDFVEKEFYSWPCLVLISKGIPKHVFGFMLQVLTDRIPLAVFDRRNINAIDNEYRRLGTTFSVPGDGIRILALLELIKSLNLNMFATITSLDNHDVASYFLTFDNLKLMGICVPVEIYLEGTDLNHQMELALKTVNQTGSRLKTLILFLDMEETRVFLDKLEELNLTRQYFLIFFYPTIKEPYVINGHEETLHGAVTIDFFHRENSEFKKYYLKHRVFNTAEQKLIRENNERFLQCFQDIGNPCKKYEYPELGFGYYPFVSVSDVIFLVNTVIQQVNIFVWDICTRDLDSECPLNEIFGRKKLRTEYRYELIFDNVVNYSLDDLSYPLISTGWDENFENPFRYRFEYFSFKYLNNSTSENKVFNFEFTNIGFWNTTSKNLYEYRDAAHEYFSIFSNQSYHVKINMSELILPEHFSMIEDFSRCSHKCPDGFYNKSHFKYPRCCWDCYPCPQSNSYAVNERCHECRPDEYPDHEFSKCRKLPVKYLTLLDDIHWKVVTGFSITQFIILLCSVTLIMKHSHILAFNLSKSLPWCMFCVGVICLIVSAQLFFIELSVQTCRSRFWIMIVGVVGVCFLPVANVLPDSIFREQNIRRDHTIAPSNLVLGTFVVLYGAMAVALRRHSNIQLLPSADHTFAYATCGIEVEFLITVWPIGMQFLFVWVALVVAVRYIVDGTRRIESIFTAIMAFINLLYLMAVIHILRELTRKEDYMGEIVLAYTNSLLGFFNVVVIFVYNSYSIRVYNVERNKFARTKSTTSSYPMNPLLIENNANVNIPFDTK